MNLFFDFLTESIISGANVGSRMVFIHFTESDFWGVQFFLSVGKLFILQFKLGDGNEYEILWPAKKLQDTVINARNGS